MATLQLKHDFPIFSEHPELVYLDSAATSLKPESVLEQEAGYNRRYTANVHRGIYALAEEATAAYEDARSEAARFMHGTPEETVFVRGTTEGINTVASGLDSYVGPGDAVVVTIMDHHSNFVPWQQLALRTRATFRVVDVREDGLLDFVGEDGTAIDLEKLEPYLSRAKVFAFPAVSNTLGTIQPVRAIVAAIRSYDPGIIIIVDAAQAAPHALVDVQAWGADFVTFSGHKMLGPTGIGVLWGRSDRFARLRPLQYGGEMVQDVSVEKTVFKSLPHGFEAGTPPIAGAIGLAEAMRYLSRIGPEAIREHERALTSYAHTRLKEEFGATFRLLGYPDPAHRAGIISFTFGSFHAHDVAQLLDEKGIAVRAGHHCTMPLHQRYKISASTRISFHVYNDTSDVDRVIHGLMHVADTLR
jgi:cysteine desulfurase/selenocysteine lyase